jgi:hypothetical protein
VTQQLNRKDIRRRRQRRKKRLKQRIREAKAAGIKKAKKAE